MPIALNTGDDFKRLPKSSRDCLLEIVDALGKNKVNFCDTGRGYRCWGLQGAADEPGVGEVALFGSSPFALPVDADPSVKATVTQINKALEEHKKKLSIVYKDGLVQWGGENQSFAFHDASTSPKWGTPTYIDMEPRTWDRIRIWNSPAVVEIGGNPLELSVGLIPMKKRGDKSRQVEMEL